MAHAWKACWVKALGGSNPPSSAERWAGDLRLCRWRALRLAGRRVARRGLVAVLVAVRSQTLGTFTSVCTNSEQQSVGPARTETAGSDRRDCDSRLTRHISRQTRAIDAPGCPSRFEIRASRASRSGTRVLRNRGLNPFEKRDSRYDRPHGRA